MNVDERLLTGNENNVEIKGWPSDTVSFGTVLTWTLVFLTLKKVHLNLKSKSSSRNLLQFLQCFAWFLILYWKTCFGVSFCSSYMYDIICIYPISVIFKLVMKWYLMRMWAGWLYPFKLGKTIWLICMHTLIWDLLLTDQTLVLDSASIEIYA